MTMCTVTEVLLSNCNFFFCKYHSKLDINHFSLWYIYPRDKFWSQALGFLLTTYAADLDKKGSLGEAYPILKQV